jgi:hypothetical protein
MLRNLRTLKAKSALSVILMTASLAAATLVVSTPADAQRWGWRGGGIGWRGGVGGRGAGWGWRGAAWRGGWGWRRAGWGWRRPGWGWGAAAVGGAILGATVASPWYGYGYGYPYGYGTAGLYSYDPYYSSGCTCQ